MKTAVPNTYLSSIARTRGGDPASPSPRLVVGPGRRGPRPKCLRLSIARARTRGLTGVPTPLTVFMVMGAAAKRESQSHYLALYPHIAPC